MWSVSQFSFAAVFVASFVCMQANGLFPASAQYHDHGTSSDFAIIQAPKNNTKCSWNCEITDSISPDQSTTAFDKMGVIALMVKYEMKVNKKCEKQTGETSGNATEFFTIWLPASEVKNIIDTLLEVRRITSSNVKLSCSLQPLVTLTGPTGTTSTFNDDYLSPSLRRHLEEHGISKDRITFDCSTDDEFSRQACVTRGNSTLVILRMIFKGIRYPVYEGVLIIVSLVAFVCYGPAIICLFSPTVILVNGQHHHVLKGASPVSFRSLVGNFFFSRVDTFFMKYETRLLILRLVVYPLLFLPPAVFCNWLLQPSRGKPFEWTYVNIYLFISDLSQPFMMVCLVCYALKAFCDSYFKIWLTKKRQCDICEEWKNPEISRCSGQLPDQIITHLRLQPLIIKEWWILFLEVLGVFVKMSHDMLSSRKTVPLFRFSGVVGFLFLVCSIPVVIILSLSVLSFVALSVMFVTTPLTDCLYPNAWFLYYSGRLEVLQRWQFVRFVECFIEMLAFFGAYVVLYFASLGVFVLMVAFLLYLSAKSMPFIVLFFLVCYYSWSCYSSFTKEYHDLGLTLFKFHRSNGQDHGSKEGVAMMSTHPEKAQNALTVRENIDNTMYIPEELFYIATGKLMPIRKRVCVLVFKVALTLIFVFLVFLLIVNYNEGATSAMKALIILLIGSSPKFVTIYIERRWKRNCEMVMEECVPKIVQEYIDVCRRAEDCEANTEVIMPIDTYHSLSKQKILPV